MWKKMVVGLISLIATFSVVYAMNQEMSAAGTTYNAGGNVTGRVNKAPSNLTLANGATNIGMQKGDKVLSGVDMNGDIGFQLLHYDNNYSVTSVSCTDKNAGTLTPCRVENNDDNSKVKFNYASNSSESAWYTMSTDFIGKVAPYTTIPDFTTQATATAAGFSKHGTWGGSYYLLTSGFTKTNYKDVFDSFNSAMNASTMKNMIASRDLSVLAEADTSRCTWSADSCAWSRGSANGQAIYHGKIAYIENYSTLFGYWNSSALVTPTNSFMIAKEDAAFYDSYALDIFSSIAGTAAGSDSKIPYAGSIKNTGEVEYIYISTSNVNDTFNLRPSLMLNTDDVVFAISPGTSTGSAKITEPNLSSGYSSIYDATINDDDMKVRLLDNTLTATLKNLKNEYDVLLPVNNGKSELVKDMPLLLDADANAVSGSVVSAIIFDADGQFMYYKPLEASKGAGTYLFDSTGLPIGDYQIAIVNEMYDERKFEPANSSAISEVKPLKIIDYKPQVLTYIAKPQSQSTYEYTKNVSPGKKIGEVSNVDGILPLTYSLIADGDNSYQNFEISGLDGNGASSAATLDINVKSNGAPDIVSTTNSLKAGTYKFCIVSRDARGNPITDVVGQNKVCISLTVEKTTSTISFNNTTKKDMKIGDSTYTDTITYSNTDSISSSDITYSLSGGVSNMLTVTPNSDPTKYDANVIGSSGTGLPTTFTISATIKETANYKSATTNVNKPIYVYKELSGLTWTPSKGSYSVSDVTNGKTVGSLLAVDGVGPYTYALAQSGDTGYSASDAANNSSFRINGANVETSSNLLAGTYKMQFKVTDAKGAVKLTVATITVTAQGQASLDFKDRVGGSIITSTGIIIKYDDTNTSLLAEGGSTTNPIEYYLADQVDQPTSLVGNATDYLTVAKIGGLLTPKKVGEVLVYAKRPGDSNYGDVKTGFMKVKIDPAPQTIAFNSTTNPSKVEVGKDLMEDAKGTVVSSNAAGVGGIIYKSNDPSKATVDATGKVTGIATGNVTITAILNDPSSSSYDPNYETKTCTKTVNVYTGMNVTWTASTPNLKAESSVSGDKAGSLQVTNNSGPITYTIVPSDGNPKNADSSFFQVINNGQSADIQLNQTITAAVLAAHTNQYYIQVAVKDGNGTQIIDVIVTIDDATNNAYFTENGSKVTAISKKYGENNNTFQLTTNTSNGGNVTYSLPSNTTSVITVSGTGKVDIKGVGTETVQAVIAAGSGYDGATITIPVTITAGDQTIAFANSTTNQAFKAGDTFLEPAVLKETTAQTVSARNIAYTSTTPSVCTIDNAGTITMLTIGNCTVTAENNDANWQATTISKTINLYSGMGVSFTQSNTPQAETSTAQVGSPVGSLTVSGGQGTKTYAVSTNTSDPKNKDGKYFSVNSSGVISLAQNINASVIARYYDATKHAYIMHAQFEVKDSLGNTITTDAEVEIKGAPLNAQFDTGGVGKITKVYSLNGTFTLNLSSNAGNGTPTYQLKNDPSMPTDVLKPNITSSGVVTIDNANDKAANANPVMVEAVIPPSSGYDGETIEVEVEITKAPQPSFGFQNTNIQMQTSSTLTPIIKGKLSTGKVTLSSNDKSVVDVATNGKDLESFKFEDTTTVNVIDAGDRNYQAATGTATVTVSSQPAYGFIISVPSATYGDTGLSASIILNGATGANQKQTWSSSDPTIADIDASGNITIYKAGSVDITCIQASTGEPSATHTVTMVIKPKPITITINNKDKYVGEAVPTFDMTIPNGVLVGSDTISLPTFHCVDGSNANVTDQTPAGSYPITGTYPTGANPNYKITVTPGTLTVKQDASTNIWYHLEGAMSGNTLDPTKWYNEDVNVVLDTATETAGTYDEISLDKTLWDPAKIPVTTEDENSEDVYFRINASDPTHPLAMSTSQPTTIRIDKTKPAIKSITGTQTNKDAISSLLNTLTFGKYFKPGTKVSIEGHDIIPSGTIKVSGLKEITYNVYEIDKTTGLINPTPKDTGTLTPNASNIIEITLNDTGLYRVCASTTDNAGNTSVESCSDLNVKKIDIDIDGDGENEFQDPDGDGCPDINIPLKDEKGVIYKLNVDINDDGIPDINIDTNGDGKADINVDQDDDQKPDLNIVDVKKWNPKICVTGQSEEYCTDNSLIPNRNIDLDGDGRPDINIDLNNDGVPDIEIDTDGDGKADINIDIDKDGTPDQKLKDMKEWKINDKIFDVDGVKFQTMTDLTEDKIDHLEDGGVIVKPGNGQIFLPNYALKVEDQTDTIDAETKQKLEALDKDKDIKQVIKVDLTKDDVVIQPDGTISVSIPVDSKIKNPKIFVEQADGSFKEVDGVLKDGYYTYDTDFLGRVSILGDRDAIEDDMKVPSDSDNSSNKDNGSTNTKPPVKGTYTPAIGGAMTGDSTNPFSWMIGIGFMGYILYKASKKLSK